ncbi:MAG TPA: M23 family metallopeptidase [Dehalococcoidia bacterium]|nr:M23 family metallopeptidase [Dehalococcoidia bacterium]
MDSRLRRVVLLGAVISAFFLLAACNSGESATSTPTVTVVPSPQPSPSPLPSSPSPLPATPLPSPTAVETPVPSLSGFIFPIAGACLPSSDNLMPNAPRVYRAGVHEGIDFYDGYSCATIGLGTPVLAAKSGLVIRADVNHLPLTPEELAQLLARSRAQGYTDAEALDRFRGRQVWIYHGYGVISRYAHLDSVAPEIIVGRYVTPGEVIGYVGNSGTPEEVSAPGEEMHLHFEIWVGDSYLGKGLPPDQVRELAQRAFSP